MTEPALPNPIKKSQLEAGLTPRGRPAAAQNGGMKGPVEIIRASAQKEIPGSNPDQVVKQVDMLVASKKVRLLQIGNTVFLIYPMPGGVAEFHTFTIEDPHVLAQRYAAGAKSLKQMGFKRAQSYSQSPAFVRIARQTGLPVRIKPDMQKIGNKMRRAYKFEVDL